MNIVRFFTSPLTNVVYSMFGWKYQEELNHNLDVISIPKSEPELSVKRIRTCPGSSDPELSLEELEEEFLKHMFRKDSGSDLNFDQKLVNRKNFNQKRSKVQKHRRR